jgi:hypothetical protein
MTQARIRPRLKSSMQSGRAQENKWLLEYEPREAQRPDPLTGWAGSGDTRGQVRIGFPTLDAAKAYCEKHGLAYHVSAAEGGPRNLKLQAYADNFRGPDISL